MKLPTRYLPDRIRSAVRFLIVGTTGAVLQTWFFMAALFFLGNPEKGSTHYYAAFAIGYMMEMFPNYLFTNWYTFNTRPTKKNAGGFLFSRAINIIVQFVLLPLALAAFPGWRDDVISMMVIFIGGCINYLICLVFFQKKRKK